MTLPLIFIRQISCRCDKILFHTYWLNPIRFFAGKTYYDFLMQRALYYSGYSGDYRERVTPLPIPNREVKPLIADGTTTEGLWESKSSPVRHGGLFKAPIEFISVGAFFIV